MGRERLTKRASLDYRKKGCTVSDRVQQFLPNFGYKASEAVENPLSIIFYQKMSKQITRVIKQILRKRPHISSYPLHNEQETVIM